QPAKVAVVRESGETCGDLLAHSIPGHAAMFSLGGRGACRRATASPRGSRPAYCVISFRRADDRGTVMTYQGTGDSTRAVPHASASAYSRARCSGSWQDPEFCCFRHSYVSVIACPEEDHFNGSKQ